jgi:SAM-dependent MidA family methyltransferase
VACPRAAAEVSDLPERLRRLIRHDGPIPVSRFMAEANAHYYATRDPFGAAGDFVTAPEVSQMFGELIGLWCVEVWRAMGGPRPLRLVELGPGRGTLMADALRAARLAPDFLAAAELHLVEASPTLRAAQRRTLPQARHWDTFGQIPDGPLLLVANEFFDALPIRQFVRACEGWRERRVGLEGERFVFTEGGEISETAPAREAAMAEVARRIVAFGGAALVIDYGYAGSAPGETLQAVRDHRFQSPLEAPGEADLTAHVDFERLAAAARAEGALVRGPVGQGAFLCALGIEARAAALRPKAGVAADAALRRLTGDEAMGSLFKVIAATHPDLPSLPGFPA